MLVEIKYGENTLYTSFVNQKLIDDKIQDLIKVSTEKNEPDKSSISKILNDLVNIAGKMDIVVDNAEVQKAVNDLAGKNNSREKVNKAMTAIAGIGKWFKTLGPIC